MKKILSASMILSLFLMAGTQQVFAEEPQGASSNASVAFEVETPTKPVDPLDPLDPLDPTKPLVPEGEGTGNTGPLTIDYVPNLAFGTQKITRGTINANSTNKSPFVQVTDVRATGAGWKLQANLSPFENKTAPTSPKITNAKITMKNGLVKTNTGKDSEKPSANSNVILTSSEADAKVDIMTAQTGKGMGTWLTTWLTTEDENENVVLSLDTTDARVGNYEATLTWTLTQTP